MRKLMLALVVALVAVPLAGAHYPTITYSNGPVTHFGHGGLGSEHGETVIFPNTADWGQGTLGDDFFDGNGGSDEFHMSKGKDLVFGNGGNDDINGNDGADNLNGDSGNDVLKGGDGNDRLDCGGGTGDSAWGGLGDDTFIECDGNGHE